MPFINRADNATHTEYRAVLERQERQTAANDAYMINTDAAYDAHTPVDWARVTISHDRERDTYRYDFPDGVGITFTAY